MPASQRSGGGGTLGFASTPANARNAALPGAITSAYASMPAKAAMLPYQPHWDSWGAAFGGSGTNRGDATVVGSHDSNATVGGVAAGADYRFSPDALADRNHEIPRDRDVVLYCTCPSEATAAKTAMTLHKLGIDRVRPLRGGFDEWKRLGFPLVAIEMAIIVQQ